MGKAHLRGDEYEYVRERYGKPWLKKGAIVRTTMGLGVVTGATNYVMAKVDGKIRTFHPNDVTEAE